MQITDDAWPPWRPGAPQARCQGSSCTPDGCSGMLVVASTLIDGLCAACARTVDTADRELRLGVDE
jgi:hypothetical protein